MNTSQTPSWTRVGTPSARIWLLVWVGLIAALVYAMILVGGATRLTDSGLSITEWKPLTGAIPPLSAEDWQNELKKYQTTTQYRAMNIGIGMEEFKVIYWWEWGHRQLGRVLGLAFLLPFLAFLALKWITPRLGLWMGAAFVLGSIQAAIGWWMVSSGIGETDRLSVAPYRLMTHFSLALLIFAVLWWAFLGLWREGRIAGMSEVSRGSLRFLSWVLLGLVALQMALGALVAGLDAGRTYTDWPLMAGSFLPVHYGAIEPWWRDPFENMASAQFHHRIGGYVLLVVSIAAWWVARSGPHAGSFRLIALLCGLQMFIGIVTILNAAPVGLALLHQGFGVLLWLAAISAVFLVRESYKVANALNVTKVNLPDSLLKTISPPSA